MFQDINPSSNPTHRLRKRVWAQSTENTKSSFIHRSSGAPETLRNVSDLNTSLGRRGNFFLTEAGSGDAISTFTRVSQIHLLQLCNSLCGSCLCKHCTKRGCQTSPRLRQQWKHSTCVFITPLLPSLLPFSRGQKRPNVSTCELCHPCRDAGSLSHGNPPIQQTSQRKVEKFGAHSLLSNPRCLPLAMTLLKPAGQHLRCLYFGHLSSEKSNSSPETPQKVKLAGSQRNQEKYMH